MPCEEKPGFSQLYLPLRSPAGVRKYLQTCKELKRRQRSCKLPLGRSSLRIEPWSSPLAAEIYAQRDRDRRKAERIAKRGRR
jgi:hypothetical protein